MNWTWFSLQFAWIVIKLTALIAFVGTVALLPFGAAVASLGVIGLAAKGMISTKVTAVLLGALFFIQGVWVLKWG